MSVVLVVLVWPDGVTHLAGSGPVWERPAAEWALQEGFYRVSPSGALRMTISRAQARFGLVNGAEAVDPGCVFQGAGDGIDPEYEPLLPSEWREGALAHWARVQEEEERK